MKKTYSVRLEEADAAIWDDLMKQWRMDRSDALRRLLRERGDAGPVLAVGVPLAPRPVTASSSPVYTSEPVQAIGKTVSHPQVQPLFKGRRSVSSFDPEEREEE